MNELLGNTHAVLKDLNTFAWVWRTASPAQTDLPGLHLIGSDGGMPELVRPTVEVHRSFLAAMAEFRGEGRGGVDDNSMIGSENREFGGTWDTLEGFVAYVQKIRREADEDAPRPAGWVPCTTLRYVEDAEYLGRLAIRHRLSDLLRDSGGHTGYDVRPTARRDFLTLRCSQSASRFGISKI